MKNSIPFVITALSLVLVTSVFAQKATPGDKAFVAKVSQGGMFEVAAGRLAQSKGSSQDIRDFATAEVHDHMLVGAKLKKISSAQGVAFSPILNSDWSGKLKHLSSLSGTAFDQAYLAEMGTLHEADGAAFAKESTDGGSSAYRAFGEETHRIVARHIGAIKATPAK